MTLVNPYAFEDLEEIATNSTDFMDSFSDGHVLVAGATGFIGSWIISSLDHMNRHHKTKISVSAISRNLDSGFISAFPDTRFLPLDISTSPILDITSPDCIINAATPSSLSHGGDDSRQVFEAATQGTVNLIDFCSKSPNQIFINLSSGIVKKREGEQLNELNNVKDAYLAGKRKSEELVNNATTGGLILGKNLRLYAFAGPGISLVDHFAVGNFMNDAIRGRPIAIKGNPETRRSYLYPTDLISNILNAAASPSRNDLELGSSEDLSMWELAQLINIVTGNTGITQNRDYRESDQYFPSDNNLAVRQQVSLETGLARWARWLRKN